MSIYYALFITSMPLNSNHAYKQIANELKEQGQLACIYLNLYNQPVAEGYPFALVKEIKRSEHCFCHTEAELRKEIYNLISRIARLIITDMADRSLNGLLIYLAKMHNLEVYTPEHALAKKFRDIKEYNINNSIN